MKKFEGNEVLMIEIEGLRFVKEDYRLWILNGHMYRSKEGEPWKKVDPGMYHNLENYREIKCGSKIYSVDINGFKEIPVITKETMIREIAKKLDLLEWTNAKFYALQPSTRVELGCERLRDILIKKHVIHVIHATNERTLYRFKWGDVIPVDLLEYEKEIKSVYERMCK